ncbi:MAG: hypothetical protein WBV18_05595 [Methyloceanibacter sp.]|jgi:hypothetical protein|uniref:hypothetical protein n=1 Tax=Methyloceanibacter sp. TaxID=1965321 RepID=UPI003C5661DB
MAFVAIALPNVPGQHRENGLGGAVGVGKGVCEGAAKAGKNVVDGAAGIVDGAADMTKGAVEGVVGGNLRAD